MLDPCRDRRSGRSGRHAGKWAVHRDPRDCRQVFFEDPARRGCWHALDWNGLPPGGDVPAFSDARVGELLTQAACAGLRPLDDRELLPVLLKLLATRTPVNQWPTQMTTAQKAERARELARARSAAADRPPATVTALPDPARPSELAISIRRAVTADRQ